MKRSVNFTVASSTVDESFMSIALSHPGAKLCCALNNLVCLCHRFGGGVLCHGPVLAEQ